MNFADMFKNQLYCLLNTAKNINTVNLLCSYSFTKGYNISSHEFPLFVSNFIVKWWITTYKSWYVHISNKVQMSTVSRPYYVYNSIQFKELYSV